MRALWPHPLLSAALALTWLLLTHDFTPINLAAAALIAWILPRATRALWPDRPRIHRPWVLARLLVRVLYDIAVANVIVARLILGPVTRLRPAFVRLPLALTDPYVVTMLANIISLTPGTVSVDVSDDRTELLIHTLDLHDERELVEQIKARYETPLKEAFGC